MQKHKQQKEALNIFRINASLYPQSANTLSSLGEGYLESGDKTKAIAFFEKSLEYNPSPDLIKEILGLLYKAKGL
ncbi:MAG: tetratricopeptide repeat protein [Chitinophagaceae bacterium]|nr:MAG: tetratricopeptide repeat protein [Chitinophagaceae bacterium]